VEAVTRSPGYCFKDSQRCVPPDDGLLGELDPDEPDGELLGIEDDPWEPDDDGLDVEGEADGERSFDRSPVRLLGDSVHPAATAASRAIVQTPLANFFIGPPPRNRSLLSTAITVPSTLASRRWAPARRAEARWHGSW
jgi:hypothetical protein